MKSIFLSAYLIVSYCLLHAQFITVREVDETSAEHLLPAGRQAIDINSKLFIDIHLDSVKQAIDRQLAADGTTGIDSLIATLKLYKNLIESLEKGILGFERLFESPRDSIQREVLKKTLAERASAGRAIVRLFPEGSRFALRREEELSDPAIAGKGSNESFRIILKLLAAEMQSIEDDLAKLREEAGFYFQLAAWYISDRGTNALHIDGFDELPPGEFFRYERNRFYLTEEQKQELQGLHNFFEERSGSNLFDKLADVLPGILVQYVNTDLIISSLQQMRTDIHNLVTSARAEKENVIHRIDQAIVEFQVLGRDLLSLKARYTTENFSATVSKTELLRAFMADVNQVSERVTDASGMVRSIWDNIDFPSLGEKALTVKTGLTDLASLLKTEAKNLVDHARDGYHTAVFGRKVNAAALELSEKVLRHSVSAIPSSAILDLHYSGERAPGDLVVVKAMLWKGDNTAPVATTVREFPVMNSLPHMHMSVAYSFAKPIGTASNWKGGPLVGILYKFGSRSLAYRNFFDPGIGLHAASFDFNNDDTPEFAGGMVASFFRDYLQAGWGFNFNANKAYWFAGLRIPIPIAPVTFMGG